MNEKRVKDSQVVLSVIMQPSDANPGGIVHGGSVMKEIDNAAGAVAIKHARNLAVTASIDRIDFHTMVFIGDLVTIRASINMAGKSSMEVGARVEAENMITGEIRHVASAYLIFVAVNDKGRPVGVPGLICETDNEKRRNREAMKRRESRLKMKAYESGCQSDPGSC